MHFSEIIGLEHIKNHLISTVESGRIAHAQLFIGNHGSGLLPIALAYARALLCAQHPEGSEAYLRTAKKVDLLTHPDLHFVYPVNTNDTIKKNAISDSFAEEWRNFITKSPYASLFQWFQYLGIENKQGNISVREAEDMSKKLALKSYEGGFKVMIVWMADKMNMECANKILKLVEEPPDKTVLLFLTEHEEHIINTIYSRCQKLHLPKLSEAAIAQALQQKMGLSENEAMMVSRKANGDYNKALQIIAESGEESIFEEWFLSWVRSAFKAKGNKKAIQDLLHWSDEMARRGRETQKNFLSYCVELFRQALLKNYQADSLIYMETRDPKFSLEKFAPFVHPNNVFDIVEALENASYHIERNGNAKIIFADLSIQLTRLIHRKEVS